MSVLIRSQSRQKTIKINVHINKDNIMKKLIFGILLITLCTSSTWATENECAYANYKDKEKQYEKWLKMNFVKRLFAQGSAPGLESPLYLSNELACQLALYDNAYIAAFEKSTLLKKSFHSPYDITINGTSQLGVKDALAEIITFVEDNQNLTSVNYVKALNITKSIFDIWLGAAAIQYIYQQEYAIPMLWRNWDMRNNVVDESKKRLTLKGQLVNNCAAYYCDDIGPQYSYNRFHDYILNPYGQQNLSGYTKLNSNGSALPFANINWNCVSTADGLIWEAKQRDGSWLDVSRKLTWTAVGSGDELDGLSDYVAMLNQMKLCGEDNWRIPSRLELLSLNITGKFPAIDTRYFPNTESGYYWTSEGKTNDANSAWNIHFEEGVSYFSSTSSSKHVRAVSGEIAELTTNTCSLTAKSNACFIAPPVPKGCSSIEKITSKSGNSFSILSIIICA